MGSSPQSYSIGLTESGMKRSETSRRTIFESFEQGVHHHDFIRNESQQPDGSVTSMHFPSMRINESTVEAYGRIPKEKSGELRSTRNLRDYRPADSRALESKGDPIQDSDDELALPAAPGASKPKYKKSPSKNGQRGRSAATRKGAAGQTFSLDFAQTYDLEATGPNLMLRQSPDNPRVFRITSSDVDGNIETIHTLDLTCVNKITSDNTHLMRLGGPTRNGGPYWFDLKFPESSEFIRFRTNYVEREIVSSVTQDP